MFSLFSKLLNNTASANPYAAFLNSPQADPYLTHRYDLSAQDIMSGAEYFEKAVGYAFQNDFVQAARYYHRSLCSNVNATCLLNLARIRKLQAKYMDAFYMLSLARDLAPSQRCPYKKDIEKEYNHLLELGKGSFLVSELRGECESGACTSAEFANILLKNVHNVFQNNKQMTLYFFYDELDSIIRFCDEDDYPAVNRVIANFNRSDIDNYLRASPQFMKAFDAVKERTYAMLAANPLRRLRSIRTQVILSLYREHFDQDW